MAGWARERFRQRFGAMYQSWRRCEAAIWMPRTARTARGWIRSPTSGGREIGSARAGASGASVSALPAHGRFAADLHQGMSDTAFEASPGHDGVQIDAERDERLRQLRADACHDGLRSEQT